MKKVKKFLNNWILPPNVSYSIKYFKRLFLNYFDNKKIDKKFNDRFKDKHNNDRCFVVGTGPSIKEQNLKLLKNEFVIGVSGLFMHEDIDFIKPDYYVLPPVFRSHGDFYKEESFISWLKAMGESLRNDVVMFLDIGDKKYIDKYKIFRDKQIVWLNYLPFDKNTIIKKINVLYMPSINSVSETAIQVAIYLGFKEIYIIGFDHSWYDVEYKHFDDNYMKFFDEEKFKNIIWNSTKNEVFMSIHSEIFNKYKRLYAIKKNIYNANANQNSYVDTFPRVRFEDLLKNKIIH